MTKIFTLYFLLLTFKGFTQCNPVANFTFNGNTNDVSGNGNNGIHGGTPSPVWASDRFGNANSAYQFGGYNNPNWIKIPNSASLTFGNTLSVSLWFKQCSFAGSDAWGNYSPFGHFILMSKSGDGVAANPGIWFWTYTSAANTLNVAFNNKNGYGLNSLNFYQDTTFDCFDACEWVHCVVVINNTSWQMYLNGQLRKQTTIAPADFTYANTQDIYLGRMFGGGIIWYPFNGIIDDVTLYNCALTQADVTTLNGNYLDPLASNNSITIDSISLSNPCSTPNSASINVYTNPTNAPYQYSLNSGLFQTSNSFTNLSQGVYTIKIKSSCTTIDTTLIIGNPFFTTTISASICEGDSYKLPNGNFVNSSGIYHDTIFTSPGCDSIFITTLTVTNTTATINASICEGSTYQLPNGKIVNSTGVYYDTISIGAGCDSIIITSLSVNQSYLLSISDTICYGEIYVLPNGSHVTSSGTYTSMLHSTQGCDSTIVTSLFAFPQLTDTFQVLHVSCYGKKDGTIQLFAIGGSAPFTYRLSGVGANSTGTFNNLPAALYEFTITDKNDCSILGHCMLTQPEPILISVKPETAFIDPDGSVEFTISCNYSNAHFFWSPTTFLSCDTCTNPTSKPDINVTYTVTATIDINKHNCSSDTTVKILINPTLYLPNAFTPNADGLNDVFQPIGKNFENLSDFKLKIFNRWGKLVFETTNPLIGWDGKFDQLEEETGVYVYVITYHDLNTNQVKIKKGNLTLIK